MGATAFQKLFPMVKPAHKDYFASGTGANKNEIADKYGRARLRVLDDVGASSSVKRVVQYSLFKARRASRPSSP